MSYAPTLLIGLGGIGSNVAANIYARFRKEVNNPEAFDKVSIICCDTDVADIKNRFELVPKENVVQTSTKGIIASYLERIKETTVAEWFPTDNRILLNKDLTTGAGQVRAASRLALMSALEQGKLAVFPKVIRDLLTLSGETLQQSMKIIFINSLAGGTGAGSFLQLSFYIRELLERDFGIDNPGIIGYFVLPDTLYSTGGIREGQQLENIRANAYACMKELDAIYRYIADDSSGINIDFEYRLGLKNQDGYLNITLPKKEPFEYCYLFDAESMTRRESLPSFKEYLKQVEDSVYFNIFSPIGDKNRSMRDNQIISLIGAKGLNRYCGSGVSHIMYPYDDITYYFSLRWLNENISNNWLKIDKLFDEVNKAYVKSIENGINVPKPVRSDHFRQNLEFYAGTGNVADRLFELAFRSTRLFNEKNQPEGTKSENFVLALETKIDDTADSNELINSLIQSCQIDEEKLKDREDSKQLITINEENLDKLRIEVFNFIHNNKNSLIREAVIADFEEPKKKTQNTDRLNFWLLSSSEAVHPLAVRYILYDIEEILQSRLDEFTATNRALSEQIKTYYKAYDIIGTDQEERAIDRLNTALNQNFLGRIAGDNLFKGFIEEYTDKSAKQMNRLKQYRNNKLKEEVFAKVIVQIKELIYQYERMFFDFKNVVTSLRQEQNNIALEHESSSYKTVKFVLGTKALKEKLYDENSASLGSGDFPVEINEQIYLGIYDLVCRQMEGNFISEEERASFADNIFKKYVIKWHQREKVQTIEGLNLNVIQAINKEAEYRGIDPEKFIKELHQEIDNLATPWVPEKKMNGQEFVSWALNPDCIRRGVLTDARKVDLYGSNLIVDPFFSKYEVVHERSVYELTLKDHFPKFKSGRGEKTKFHEQKPGLYYEAYCSRIQKVNKNLESEDGVTPHLDVRWHLPNYLPNIGEDQNFIQERIFRAFILGISLSKINLTQQQGDYTWKYTTPQGLTRIINNSKNKPSGPFLYTLIDGLYSNPAIVDEVIKMASDINERDKLLYAINNDLGNTRFYKGISAINYLVKPAKTLNILSLLALYSDQDEVHRSKREEEQEILFKTAINEICEYFINVTGKNNKTMTAVKKLVQDLQSAVDEINLSIAEDQIDKFFESR